VELLAAERNKTFNSFFLDISGHSIPRRAQAGRGRLAIARQTLLLGRRSDDRRLEKHPLDKFRRYFAGVPNKRLKNMLSASPAPPNASSSLAS
jgi:hypothetical protein